MSTASTVQNRRMMPDKRTRRIEAGVESAREGDEGEGVRSTGRFRAGTVRGKT